MSCSPRMSDAEEDRDDRVDVGEQRRARRADVVDEGEEHDEGDRGAQHREGEQRHGALSRGHLSLREEGDGQVEESDGGEREGDRAERGHIAELARDDERRDRVAERDQEHLADREEARRPAGREPRTDHDDPDSDESDDEADRGERA